MRRLDGTGKWPMNCPACGCPGVITRNDPLPEHERIVWGYETLDDLLEEVRILNAIIDAGMPHSVRDALRDHYDPHRGQIVDWCADTQNELWEEENKYEDT
jgi:hypothetical protein